MFKPIILRNWKLLLIVFVLLISVVYGFNLANQLHFQKETDKVIRKNNEIIEYVKQNEQVAHDVDVMSDDDVHEQLLNNGWYRD